MVGGKTVPQPSGVVRRLPQAFSQHPRAGGLPPPAAFPLFIRDPAGESSNEMCAARRVEHDTPRVMVRKVTRGERDRKG